MSLSELLMGLFLSAFLGSLLLQQFTSLSQQSVFQLNQFSHQFEQILIKRLISDSVRQAGFLPCGSQSVFNIWDSNTSSWIRMEALTTKPHQLIANYMDGHFQPLSPESTQSYRTRVAGGLTVVSSPKGCHC